MPSDTGDHLAAAVQSVLDMLKQRYERDLHNHFAREAAAKIPVHRAERDAAIRSLVNQPDATAVAVADRIRGELVARGISADRLRWAGISHDTVRNIAERGSAE